ncbi:unnamed protein product [Lampetra planeri]
MFGRFRWATALPVRLCIANHPATIAAAVASPLPQATTKTSRGDSGSRQISLPEEGRNERKTAELRWRRWRRDEQTDRKCMVVTRGVARPDDDDADEEEEYDRRGCVLMSDAAPSRDG